MGMRRVFHLSGLAAISLALVAPLLQAGEFAVLSTGFRLHADRHESSGALVKLFSADGVTELPAALIAFYEDEDAPATVLAPATVPPAYVPSAAEPAAPPVTSASIAPAGLADDAARKFSLPESFVRSVMQVESAFQPAAVSPKGAIGLMQLMPATARDLGVDPLDPRQNAEGGAAYLRDLLARYESDPNQVLLALAAYNAGPAAVERYHGVPPWPETRQYILRVLRAWSTNEANSPEHAASTGK
jgi:soluble lytic murein transglycosylase-like protein